MDGKKYGQVAAQQTRVDIDQTKARLVDAARQFDPLAGLRKHPLMTIGAAAGLGIAWGSLFPVGRQSGDRTDRAGQHRDRAGIVQLILSLAPGILRGGKMLFALLAQRRAHAGATEHSGEATVHAVADPNDVGADYG